MARILTCGYEQQTIVAGTNNAEGQNYWNSGGSIETTVVRSGSASYLCDAAAEFSRWTALNAKFSTALDRWYYLRAYVRMSAAPTANTTVFDVFNTSGTPTPTQRICNVQLLTTGKLRLRGKTTTTISPDSLTLSADTWYRVELGFRVPSAGGATGSLRLWVDGALQATSDTTDIFALPLDHIYVGAAAGTPGVSLYFDDVALNDGDASGNQDGLPGPGKIVLLKPTSDVSRTGWTDGNGGTSNLFDSLDNIPPVGEATSGTTATSQIEDGNSNTTDTYVADLQSYTTGGIVATDTVVLTQVLAVHGNSTTTARTIGFQQTSNPSGAEIVPASVAAAGTYPTGWITDRSVAVYSPSVTLGTSPQLTVRKATASTDVAAVCCLGLYVEYRSPIAVAVGQATETDTAGVIAVVKTRSAAQATETDVAQAATSHKTVAVIQAAETDTAQTVTFASSAEVGQASETDAAQAVSVLKTVQVGQAGETDLAQTVTRYGVVNQATETDEAQPITVVQASLATTSGGGWAQPVRLPRKHQFFFILGAEEHDQALPLQAVKKPSRIQIEDDELLLLL